MSRRWVLMLGVAMTVVLTACQGHLLQRKNAKAEPRPDQVMDFNRLYSENCAACHGEHGRGGASIALASPVYLAVADDAVLRKATAEGVPGTTMPAFAQSSGGMLTDAQISVLVRGMRNWAKPPELAGSTPPPYASSAPGDAKRGAQVFQTFCSSCHGSDGKGGTKAGSVVNPSYLALVSDQNLRTIVIMGRPALNAPDWRNNLPGHPMTDEDVRDVVAWLASHRIAYPGQPYPTAGTPTPMQGGKQ